MNKILFILGVFALCFSAFSLQAITNYAEVYPNSLQHIQFKGVFSGDRHGKFEGDLMAILEDGSEWKVHPKSRATFESWSMGDIVRVKVRTDWYWFKREHKFQLYNHTKGQTVNVMLTKHIDYPSALKITSVETYFKSYGFVPHTKYVFIDGELKPVTKYSYEPTNPRKVIMLSDGTTWVIKDNLNDFQIGSRVYLGAQGVPNVFYDFVLISGDQREAIWTWARPQK